MDRKRAHLLKLILNRSESFLLPLIASGVVIVGALEVMPAFETGITEAAGEGKVEVARSLVAKLAQIAFLGGCLLVGAFAVATREAQRIADHWTRTHAAKAPPPIPAAAPEDA